MKCILMKKKGLYWPLHAAARFNVRLLHFFQPKISNSLLALVSPRLEKISTQSDVSCFPRRHNHG